MFREPTVEFLKAQTLRLEAFDRGVYELREGEGFTCPECGWRGLSAPMADDTFGEREDGVITQCPECGRPSPETNDNGVEPYKRFGYPYDKQPEDVESTDTTSVEDYIGAGLTDDRIAVLVVAELLGLFEDERMSQRYEDEYESLLNEYDGVEEALESASSIQDVQEADVGFSRRQFSLMEEYAASMTDGEYQSSEPLKEG